MKKRLEIGSNGYYFIDGIHVDKEDFLIEQNIQRKELAWAKTMLEVNPALSPLSEEELKALEEEASQPAIPTRESLTAEILELRKQMEAKQMLLLKL